MVWFEPGVDYSQPGRCGSWEVSLPLKKKKTRLRDHECGHPSPPREAKALGPSHGPVVLKFLSALNLVSSRTYSDPTHASTEAHAEPWECSPDAINAGRLSSCNGKCLVAGGPVARLSRWERRRAQFRRCWVALGCQARRLEALGGSRGFNSFGWSPGEPAVSSQPFSPLARCGVPDPSTQRPANSSKVRFLHSVSIVRTRCSAVSPRLRRIS